MATYRVQVREETYRENWIEASSEEDAREQAENQDWRSWSIDKDALAETCIVDITKIKE